MDNSGHTHLKDQSVNSLVPNLKRTAWIYAARALPKLSRYLRVLRSYAKTG
jgi:hypothetical protein